MMNYPIKKFVFYSFFHYSVRYSRSVRCSDAHVAQLVEHFLGKGEVTGSNPVAGSKGYPVRTFKVHQWQKIK